MAARTKNQSTNKKNFSHSLIPLVSLSIVVLICVIFVIKVYFISQNNTYVSQEPEQIKETNLIDLPHPQFSNRVPLETTIKNRHLSYNYQDKTLPLSSISQLLWSAQGITTDWGDRTVPSVKAAYPLSVYLIANNIEELEPGFYQYLPGDLQIAHQLLPLLFVDLKTSLTQITDQYSLQHAPAIIVITGNFKKMTDSFSGLPHDYLVYLEAGHTAQNLLLQAEALGLGVNLINTIETEDQDNFKDLLKIKDNETIISLLPLGYQKN